MQNLPIDSTYHLKWINYGFRGNNSLKNNVYIFDKDIYKMKDQNYLPKCIVGKDLAIKTNGWIVQGNHHFSCVEYEGSGFILNTIERKLNDDLIVAHFPSRSVEQYNSKVINGWLTNIAEYGKNCYYARGWQKATYDSFQSAEL